MQGDSPAKVVMKLVVTRSVLHCKLFTKICYEHHVYMLMHVIKSVDQFP